MSCDAYVMWFVLFALPSFLFLFLFLFLILRVLDYSVVGTNTTSFLVLNGRLT